MLRSCSVALLITRPAVPPAPPPPPPENPRRAETFPVADAGDGAVAVGKLHHLQQSQPATSPSRSAGVLRIAVAAPEDGIAALLQFRRNVLATGRIRRRRHISPVVVLGAAQSAQAPDVVDEGGVELRPRVEAGEYGVEDEKRGRAPRSGCPPPSYSPRLGEVHVVVVGLDGRVDAVPLQIGLLHVGVVRLHQPEVPRQVRGPLLGVLRDGDALIQRGRQLPLV